MPVQLKYKFLGQPAPQVVNQNFDGQLTPDNNAFSDNYHPLFNFTPEFVRTLESIGALELAESIPYISLSLLNAQGGVLQNFNISFLHKTIDVNNIHQGVRYGDRPNISLKGITIEVDEASGYLSYTKVNIEFKVHAPTEITNTSLQSLLYSGAPLKLEYGWSNSRASSFLNVKETLLINVSTYDITYDTTGQIDLSVSGYAFNDMFNNILVGDEAINFNAAAARQKNPIHDGKGEIFEQIQDINNFLQHIQDVINSGGRRDNNILAQMNARVVDLEKRGRGPVASKFKEKLTSVKTSYVRRVNRFGYQGLRVVTLHDLFSTLCGDTIRNAGDMFKGIREINVIYGRFNEKAGEWANKSIAEFPIPYKKFINLFNKNTKRGILVPTMGRLFNFIIGEFLQNPKYFITPNSNNNDASFSMPQVVINSTTRNDKFEIQILDLKYNVPVTTATLRAGLQTQQQLEQEIIVNQHLPIVRLGHANSFIKDAKLSNVVDSNMKSAMVVDMQSARIGSPRDTRAIAKGRNDNQTSPLLFPIRGILTVLGHPQWRPFRFFWLDTGTYFLDGVYKILGVKHHLGVDGFTTELDIMFN